MVRTIFTDRITDGQLDDAPLTSRELGRMQHAFIESILSDRHKRIKYPDKKRPHGRS